MLQSVSKKTLELFGWQVDSVELSADKYVIIGAPHTSNWDFPLALLTIATTGLKFSWAAKNSLFFFPLGSLFKKIGGIPVNRKVRNDFLNVILKNFNENESFSIAIAPEGTRSFTDHWKCGFYQIAYEAKVNIALGYLDFNTKTLGIGAVLKPSGNIEEDFKDIVNFYDGKTGIYPEKQSTLAIRPKEIRFLAKQFKKKNLSKDL